MHVLTQEMMTRSPTLTFVHSGPLIRPQVVPSVACSVVPRATARRATLRSGA